MSSIKEKIEIPILFKDNYLNLHDVFLNASLQRSMMIKSPIVPNDINLITDHFRFERTWLMFLYVLYEAWEAPMNKSFRLHLYNTLKLTDLQITLSDLRKKKKVLKLKNLRDYMAHRDKREYWDIGRTDILNNLKTFDLLHQTFSEFFLSKKSFVE
ncbi:hypothetical protein [Leptospira meyeri]|uniref:hypothetical protein n=1 Tax=Leptospira meyeri TaxID=29508 RepID=UPI0014384595|nr:hypothetical protein [Leptospira meyeri]